MTTTIIEGTIAQETENQQVSTPTQTSKFNKVKDRIKESWNNEDNVEMRKLAMKGFVYGAAYMSSVFLVAKVMEGVVNRYFSPDPAVELPEAVDITEANLDMEAIS